MGAKFMDLKKLIKAIIALAVIGWVLSVVELEPLLAMFQSDGPDGEAQLLEQCISARMREDFNISRADAEAHCRGPRRQPLLQ